MHVRMIENETAPATGSATRKQRRNAPARKSPPDTPELRAEILRLLRSGVTMTEMCVRPDMPPLASLFNIRRNDPAFGAEFTLAMAEHAEALISDAMDQSIAAADYVIDQSVNSTDTDKPCRAGSHEPNAAKSAEFYLNSALKYAGAIAPAKYGTLLKISDAQLGNGLQISITSYATAPSAEGPASPADTGSAPSV